MQDPRADESKLREIFEKYASVERAGEKFMTYEDFIVKYLNLYPSADDVNLKKSIKVLGGILDTSKDGVISFIEFSAFEAVLCQPDALYRTAFQLFDTNGSGTITHDEFEEIIKLTTLHAKIPFDFKGQFMALHFGEDRKRVVSFAEFSQVLHDFHEEHAIQAFKKKDKGKTGTISTVDFADIMSNVKSHLLSPYVRANLAVCHLSTAGNRITFPYFMAFNSLLNNMELVKKIYLSHTKGNTHREVSREEFLYAAQQMSEMTPLEIDVLYHLAAAIPGFDGRVTFSDLEKIAPFRPTRFLSKPIVEAKAVTSPEERSVSIQFLEFGYRFTLGSIGGATGSFVVYPIDLVKTRMQNQRTGSYIGELMYRNSWDCFKKVIRHEGVLGLYRGLPPQLVGVCPEKAIKLAVNDFVRDKLSTSRGDISVASETFAGCCAGASQVMFTNPLEIVKIRLQVAGEITSGPRVKAWTVMKDLGIKGLYKGSKACFLRDVPFSAIYFPIYAQNKLLLADADGHNTLPSVMAAGTLAAIPAAYLVTPADVIKTRLQVAARSGQTTYNGIIDAASKIFREEGFRAFWKGGPARILRSSPQFGFTLWTYETLQRYFYVDFGGNRPSGSDGKVPLQASEMLSQHPDHIGGYKLALTTFSGMESKFGLFFPKFEKVH